ncbi:MAG: DNA topoisomerase IB, partial [Burkholderiaceae bacterium]|nr:DNA topoisomerase IB [Burkholderiaceae bacterium]
MPPSRSRTSKLTQTAPSAASAPSVRPARLAGGLVYVSPTGPGITRVRSGAKGFRYGQPDGQWLKDLDEIARIQRLAIPPAYTDVWICPLPHGHLQATGLDARGRTQYRYHPEWRLQRDESKFEHMQAFGRVLPRIRTRIARDLASAKRGEPLTRTRVLAALVRLLDTTFLRVGNE